MTFVNRLPKLIKDYKSKNKRPDGSQPTDGDIAKLASIDPATFSRYKNSNVNSINMDVWQRLSNFFGVPGHEIFNVEPSE